MKTKPNRFYINMFRVIPTLLTLPGNQQGNSRRHSAFQNRVTSAMTRRDLFKGWANNFRMCQTVGEQKEMGKLERIKMKITISDVEQRPLFWLGNNQTDPRRARTKKCVAVLRLSDTFLTRKRISSASFVLCNFVWSRSGVTGTHGTSQIECRRPGAVRV